VNYGLDFTDQRRFGGRRKPSKSYIGRTNRNGTVVTRATFDRLDQDWLRAMAERAVRRAVRWLKSNDGKELSVAPRHIRERVGA
jgi:hypothetical protein